jgi:hypothetical protein
MAQIFRRGMARLAMAQLRQWMELPTTLVSWVSVPRSQLRRAKEHHRP